jgi:hypothetical protein
LQVPLHVPPAQVGVAMLLLEQAMPQPPQFAGPVLVEISQPFVSLLLSQSPNPGLQVPLHVPPAQVGVAMLLLEQAMPQPPQLFGSELGSVQAPAQQTFPLQLRPQALQFAESVLLSVQVPLQQMELAPLAATQSIVPLQPIAHS